MILDIGKSPVVTRFFGHLLRGPALPKRSNFFSTVRSCSVYDRRPLCERRRFQQATASNTLQVSKCFSTSEKSPKLMDRLQFENVCSETLESLTEYFEELIETVPKLKNGDVHYNDGVLTVNLGNSEGIYVINKQGSNFQIWLSSPKSGPKRYDYVDGAWVYRHDRSTLHALLNEEIGDFISAKVAFTERCSHAKANSAMEVMEEGNLLDRVRILLQRDLDYYSQHQAVLQETLCSGMAGGLLDFPRYASFAAVKLVMWWEAQFKSAFQKTSGLSKSGSETEDEGDRGCGGVVANLAPSEFVQMVEDTAAQLLEHLHILSQEALDHADLTVLTGTLGASALIKNTLWCYNENFDSSSKLSLHSSLKQYQEMSEALAERLLDLHCRLLSLYVLQDADCLSWESPHPFFEGERGSFIVQMWWLYMQGTRQDLWNTVPPKTAQRVLAGMLNETLTILASRYCQAEPSPARTELLVTDIGNLLLCVNETLPSICNDASELVGFSGSKILRDIHCKCHQLLICLVLRGCPLYALFKVFKNGLLSVKAFENRAKSISPWMIFVSPDLQLPSVGHFSDIPDGCAIMLELKVLSAQPQPCYPLVLSVLTMRGFQVAALLLRKFTPLLAAESGKYFPTEDTHENNLKCDGFLCSESGDCKIVSGSAHEAVLALAVVFMNVCTVEELNRLMVPAFELIGPSWASCLDRHQVWNLNRPPWLAAFISPLETPLRPLVNTLIKAANSGMKVQDCVVLALEGLVKLSDVIPPQVFKVALVLQENIPADVKPVGKSVLLQLLALVVYALLVSSQNDAAIALAEALCHMKVPPHIIEQLEDHAEEFMDDHELALVSDITVSRILFTRVGRRAMKTLYHCIVENESWLVSSLLPGYSSAKPPNKLLYIMFHIGVKPFDQILTGEWNPDYLKILDSPLSLSKETAWLHLSRRPEFLDPSHLSKHDKAVVESLSSLFLSAE